MNFFKRHKNKFIGLGVASAIGAGGLYLLNKYVESQIEQRREIETQQKLKQIQRQKQFEKTREIGLKTLNNALLPAVKAVIDEIFETEGILEKLRSDPNNTQLWHDLKLCSFAKNCGQVIGGALVAVLIKIQLQILAGFKVQNNNPLPEKVCLTMVVMLF